MTDATPLPDSTPIPDAEPVPFALVSIDPPPGSVIASDEPIELVFTSDPDVATLVLDGQLGDVAQPQSLGHRILLTPVARWPDGLTQSVGFHVESTDGEASSGSAVYRVLFGTLVYAHPDGTRDAAGSKDAPVSSLSRAVDIAAAQAPATVVVAGGAYAEAFELAPQVWILGGFDPTDFFHRDAAQFRSVASADGCSTDVAAADTVRTGIEGMVLTSAVLTAGCSTTILRNEFEIPDSGFGLRIEASDVIVRDNRFTTGFDGTAIRLEGDDTEISGNRFEGGGSGMSIDVRSVSGATIANNVLDASPFHIGMNLSLSTVSARNNTLVTSIGGVGINVVFGSPSIDNNVIQNFGVGIRFVGNPPSIRNNSIVAGDSAVIDFTGESCASSTNPRSCTVAELNQLPHVEARGGNIDVAAELEGNLALAESADCRLREGGLNGGVHGFESVVDFTGVLRTANLTCAPTNEGAGGWSMGAFETD